MKTFTPLVLALALASTIGCDENKDYPIEPSIELKSLEFATSPSFMDSLTLTLEYRDGDSDLGFVFDPTQTEEYIKHWSTPYNAANLFLGEDGIVSPISTYMAYTNDSPPRYFNPVLNAQDGSAGKLVTAKTRNNPVYSNLPENMYPDKCMHYREMELYVIGNDFIDETYNIVDTLHEFNPPVYVVKEQFYCQPNENYYNIFVDYLVKQPNGAFEKFDWSTSIPGFCAPSFHARFPAINTAPEIVRQPFTIVRRSNRLGILSYAMKSDSFEEFFEGKTLKLQVTIKDRALHTSNMIETEEFTLESIQK